MFACDVLSGPWLWDTVTIDESSDESADTAAKQGRSRHDRRRRRVIGLSTRNRADTVGLIAAPRRSEAHGRITGASLLVHYPARGTGARGRQRPVSLRHAAPCERLKRADQCHSHYFLRNHNDWGTLSRLAFATFAVQSGHRDESSVSDDQIAASITALHRAGRTDQRVREQPRAVVHGR